MIAWRWCGNDQEAIDGTDPDDVLVIFPQISLTIVTGT